MCRVGEKKKSCQQRRRQLLFFPPSLNPPTPPSVIGSYGFNSSPIPKSGSDIRAYSQRKPNPSLSEKNLGNQVLHKQDEQSKILQINRLQQHTHCSTSRPGGYLPVRVPAFIALRTKILLQILRPIFPQHTSSTCFLAYKTGGGREHKKEEEEGEKSVSSARRKVTRCRGIVDEKENTGTSTRVGRGRVEARSYFFSQ